MVPLPRSPLSRRLILQWLLGAALLVLVLLPTIPRQAVPAVFAAGPVEWVELPAAEEGRQWWDRGSLRWTRDGHLSVLSRFSPASGEESGDRSPSGTLYVMQLDCGQGLYRDTSVNGLPRPGARWQLAAGDALLESLLQEVCAAGAPLRPSLSQPMS
jgi:hypothetical protein